jgi:hypothetical protein
VAELESLLPYDTGAMRDFAQALNAQARQAAAVADAITGSAHSLVFDGPAGDRIRSSLGGCARTVTGTAEQLTATASQILSSAADVDAQNAAIRAHNATVLAAMTPVERKLVGEGL